ncbi:MAG: methylenetetrahydrofolate reductase [NAD(P)H] [Vampirovibrionales bacterium]
MPIAPSPQCPSVSFEFFPPNTPEANERLWQALNKLAPLQPSFVSVTYGAGGSTRERTHDTVARLLKETTLAPAAHLTCVSSTREEMEALLQRYWQLGVRHLVALRGDVPQGQTPEEAFSHYRYASDLITHIHQVAPFEVSVAGYPEAHPESINAHVDIDRLKRKVDLGANRIITQFFFEAETFLRFRDACDRADIQVPIVPGILPISNVKQTLHFAGKCGAKVPQRLVELFEGLDDDPDTRRLIASSEAIKLCETLQRNGLDQFHFYTLNRSDLVFGICHALGVRPQVFAPATSP